MSYAARVFAVLCFLGSVCAGAPVLAAQTVGITGSTVDAVSGRPVAGAQLTIGPRKLVTDAEGRFRLDVAAGRWEIEVSAPNYTSRKITIEAGSTPLAPIVIQLVPENVFQERLEVTASAPAPRLDEPATIPLAPQQVLSSAGSLDNPFRTLATMPGVAATDEIGSKLSVRGGAPDQNLTIMDGIEMHNPYRLFGLTSAFNPETVKRFDLLAGGFSAKYGDRLSSVIVVENRDGDASHRFSGSSSISITDANIIGEGRLPGPGQGTWLATMRRTYYDLVAERFVHQDLPSFNDTQIKTAWQLPGGRRLSLLGLRSRETTTITPDAGEDVEGFAKIRSRNDLAAATLVSPLGRAVSTSVVAWSRNTDLIDAGEIDDEPSPLNDPDRFARQLSIDDLSLREEVQWPAFGSHQLEAGTEWHGLKTRVAFNTFDDLDPFGLFRGGAFWLGGVFPSHVDDARTTTRGGAWIEDRFKLGSAVTLVPGLRWDWSSLTGRGSLSPRLSAVMALNPLTRLTAAGGLYSQSPGYEKLLQADHFTDLSASERDLRPERATHFILGIDRDFGGLQARVEGYYKGFSDLIAGRLETEEERLARLARYAFPAVLASTLPVAPLITSVPTNDSKGYAYGVDMFLTRPDNPSRPRLTGWLSYSLSKTQQEIYGRRVPFSYDRPHAVSVVWNWRAGSHFELAGTARVASGFPRTPPAGSRVETREVGARLVPRTTGPGQFVLEVAPGGVDQLNAARMPTFARLDLRLGYRPRGVGGRWQIYLESLNVLGRNNAWFMDANLVPGEGGTPRLQEEPVGGLPRLVTFGIRFRFP